MKCTDIQINDWVYLSEATKYAMRVTSIDEDHCYLDFEGNEGDPFDGIYGEKDGIAPIPLTDEMLYANGWRFEILDDCWTHIKTSKVVIEQSLDNDRPVFSYDNGEFAFTYVHELQHLFRLCGLDNFADNFKIE